MELGWSGAERGVINVCALGKGLGRAIFSYSRRMGGGGGVILFYNRNWHTFDPLDIRGNSFQF